ncbi:MAG: hypothetical protein ABEI77_03525 [Halorientalis sp.]
MVQFPNLGLEPPVTYRPLSETTSANELRQQLERTDLARKIERLFTLLQKAVDNTYSVCYSVFDIDSDHPETQHYFGISQLLNRRYWAGYYYCCRGLHFGCGNDRCLTTVRKLNGYWLEEESPNPSSGPLYPFSVPQSVTEDNVIEEFQKLTSVETTTWTDVGERVAVAEANLRFVSVLLAYIQFILDGHTETAPDEVTLRSHLALSHLLSLQPEKAKHIARKLLYEVTGPDVSLSTYPNRLLAQSEALMGRHHAAGDALSQTSRSVLKANPTLISDCYRYYQRANASEAANEFICELYDLLDGQFFLDVTESQFNTADRFIRLVQLAGRMRGHPPILISTISKSGSTFLTNQISDRLALPHVKLFTTTGYHDSRPVPQAVEQFAKGGALCRQHFAPQDAILEMLAHHGIQKLMFHLRDPRRALISWVFYKEATLRRSRSPGSHVRGTTPWEYAETDFAEKIELQVDSFLKPTVELIDEWVEAARNNPYGIEIKITRFEDMIEDPDAFFADVFDYYGVREWPFVSEVTERAKARLKPHKTDKKRGSNIDEWEEYIPPETKKSVLDTISPSVRSIYPEIDWTV